MDILIENQTFILKGLAMTLAIAVATLLFSTVIAAVLGVLASLKNKTLRLLIWLYVEFFRAIPLVVNIFCIYFVLPLFDIHLSPFWAVTVGLTLWGSANGIEIVRGGILSIPSHQWRSAWALGMSTYEIYRYVIGPQALRAIVPPFTGLLTLLVQATSLGALVGVSEFLKVSQIIVERETVMGGESPAFTVYAVVLLVYFVICSLLTWLSRYLERRLNATKVKLQPSSM
jgi:polar amino acid transport system permease protein